MQIIIASVAAYLLVLGAIIWAVSKRRQRLRIGTVDKLAAVVKGEPKTLSVGARSIPGIEWQQAGATFNAYLRVTGKYEYVVLRLPTQMLPAASFRPENARDRFGKRLRLNREIQTGDAAFDQAIYVETDAPLDQYLEHAPFRDAVKKAVDTLGSVRFTPTGIEVSYQLPRFNATPELLGQVTATLAELAKTLPPLDLPQPHALAHGDIAAGGLWLAMLLGYCYSFATGILRPDGFEPIVHTPLKEAAGLAWVVLVVASYFWVRGHSRSLRNFLLINFALPFVCAIWLPALGYVINATFDDSAPEVRAVKVLSKKSYSGSRSATRYFVRTVSWRPEWEKISIRIPRSVFTAAEPDKTALVTLRSGAFGWQWVEQVSVQP